jgi:hypothetical protein
VFQNRVFKRTLRLQKDEETRAYRELKSEEPPPQVLPFTKYYQDDQTRKMIWVRQVERMGKMRKECKVVVRKREGNRPLGSPRG